MTIAAGIVMLEARSQPPHQRFAHDICERFARLGQVQELVLDPTRNTSLAQVLPLMADLYGGDALLKIGALPDVRLGDAATQALALTFGELATNSLKYGALRAARPVAVAASLANGILQFVWREPTNFGAPREGAQGWGLIARIVAAVGGNVDREIEQDALVVRISLPAIA